MSTRTGLKIAGWLAAALVFGLVVACALPALAYTISGKVTQFSNGQPVQGAELQIWYWDTTHATWYRAGLYRSSGQDGGYSFDSLSDGIYRVQCYNNTGYLDQWWSQQTDPNLASSITFPGDTGTDVNFPLFLATDPTDVTLSGPAVCEFGKATLSGDLSSEGTPLASRSITINGSSGSGMVTLGTATTDGTGHYTFLVSPTVATMYQAAFAGDSTYSADDSPIANVLPKAWLGKPSGPSTTSTKTKFTSYGYLKPRHAPGTYAVYIECQRYQSHTWVTRLMVKAKAANSTSGGVACSKCSAKLRLTKKGSWRIRLVHKADAQNALSQSAWRSIKVR